MKRRWLIYAVGGALFGVFDFFYLILLNRFPGHEVFGSSPAGQLARFVVLFLVLNLGLWLVPVVPIALHEVRSTGSALRTALAGVLTWSAGIVAYYLTNAAQLAVGVPGREELAVTNFGSPHYWTNWAYMLQGDILGGILEYMLIAISGGALVGFLTGWIHLYAQKPLPRQVRTR